MFIINKIKFNFALIIILPISLLTNNNLYCFTNLAPPSISQNIISKEMKIKIKNRRKKKNDHLYNFPGLSLYLKLWKIYASYFPEEKEIYKFYSNSYITLLNLKIDVIGRLILSLILTAFAILFLAITILKIIHPVLGFFVILFWLFLDLSVGIYPFIWLRNVKNIVEKRIELHKSIDLKCVETSM